jgi:hypothetical protein
MALSKIDTPAIADAAVTDAKSAVDLSALATNAALSSTQSDLATANATIASLRSDIGSLALQSARADNQAAFNLGNSFVDQFEDVTGIDTTSSTTRDDSEYVSAFDFGSVGKFTLNSNNLINYSMNAGSNNSWSVAPQSDGVLAPVRMTDGTVQSSYSAWIDAPTGFDSGWGYDFGSEAWVTKSRFYNFSTHARFKNFRLETSNDGSSWTLQQQSGTDSASGYAGPNTFTQATNTEGWAGTEFTSPKNARYVRMMFDDYWPNGNLNAGLEEVEIYGYPNAALAASGNFTGVTQTAASSVSEMSIVVLYEDNAGTATLNTDITAEVSANNGADWSTVTLAPAGNFSANLKLSKSAPVSVTAGTQPKYRINFANQASGSKVTRIQGVALVY